MNADPCLSWSASRNSDQWFSALKAWNMKNKTKKSSGLDRAPS